jgi:hypothetical protein
MIKSTINCSENGCCNHVRKYKKLELLVVRRGGELGWVVDCSLGGESWDGEEEGEIEEESTVGRVGM